MLTEILTVCIQMNKFLPFQKNYELYFENHLKIVFI
jgi:hypothetical protein